MMWTLKLLFCIALLRDVSCREQLQKGKTTTSSAFSNKGSVSTTSTTTDEPTFSNDITTTSSTPTTAPEKICQNGESMIMKRDIQVMIKYYLEQSNFQEILNNGYDRCKHLVNNKEDQLEEFVQWFHEKPEHLKHVLKVLTEKRLSAEAYIEAIANQLQYLPVVQNSYENNQDEFKKLVEKYNKIHAICQWRCENKGLSLDYHNKPDIYRGYDWQNHHGYQREHDYASHYVLRQRSQTIESEQSYYCISLKDLNDKVNNKVSNFKTSFKNKIVAELTLTSEELNKTIEQFKGQLKDAALNNFGRIMYDILTLQDEMIHFHENGSVDVESIIGEVQEIKLGVEQKLMQLRRHIDAYGSNCPDCPDHHLTKLAKGVTYSLLADSEEIRDMVDVLFDHIVKEIEDNFSQYVKQTVRDLSGKMNTTSEVFSEYTEAHTAIQDHIKQITAEESFHYQKLSASLESIDNFVNLKQNYESLYENITNYILALK